MRHIHIVGIGTGNPEHMTVQAINALNSTDVIFIPSKGAAKAELADVRKDICERYITNKATRFIGYDVPSRRTADRSYVQGVDEWHEEISAIYERLFLEHLTEDESAAFLVWGDPGLYDSTLRIIERVAARSQVALDYSVIPGITSIQALTASHRIPLNLVGKPVQITTGRRLAESFPGGIAGVRCVGAPPFPGGRLRCPRGAEAGRVAHQPAVAVRVVEPGLPPL